MCSQQTARRGCGCASGRRSPRAVELPTCSYRIGSSPSCGGSGTGSGSRARKSPPTTPLFANQSGRRISKRRVQFAWAAWQRQAGFDGIYGFHALRHTAVTNVYRASRDLFLAQRFARHASPLTTTVYTHPSDQETAAKLRHLTC
ncbi:MAG TPA: tyrosine-type recombinase/integrase [Candidatus Polarisedimenticolaceae bacterium]|nr:tyrosine-type recombinase/integrase [Candidatus Polarisedimenticolaceae bacterium]